jgi:integrase/recombinase XerD
MAGQARKPPPGTYWRGATLWGRVQVAGREIRFSLRTDDVEVAIGRLEARRQREVAAAHYGDQRVTWEDAVLAWGDHIVTQASPSTVQRYAVSLKQLEPYLLGMYLDEIDRGTVAEIVRKRRPNVTIATIRRDLTALSSVLGFCIDEEWRTDNPALDRLKRLKERRDPITLPDIAHIRLVVERAPGNFSKLIEAARLTGCRQSELVTAERRQIDHDRRQLTIIGKGRKLRTIDLSPEAYAVFASITPNLRTKAIFWHGAGSPYRNVSSRFALFVKSAQMSAQDFRPFRFHDLRHLFAVEYLKQGRGSIYDLKGYLGHSNVSTTEIYLRYLTPDEALSATRGFAQKAEHMQRFENGEAL